MYRERLKSFAGCIRCKRRHHKCDEKRPQCSFCTRHNVKCIWPARSQPQRKVNQRLAIITSWKSSSPKREPARGKEAASLDPFHNMPVHYSDDLGVKADHLHSFFIRITQSTLPFDVANTHHELTRGWLESFYSDEAVCSSFITYCAWFYSERITQQSKLTSLCLTNEARSLALLRHRIERNEPITEGTLLAAVLHFFIATFNTNSVSQLFRIAQGVSALVAAKGGSNTTMRNISPSTRQSLIYVDVFNSLLSAYKPFLDGIELPLRPPSYDLLFKGSQIKKEIADCLGQELTDILEDLRFVLFFRMPSQQPRCLSFEESWYLFMLLQKISYELCNQQSRLVTSGSLAEIAIYGMILVKEEVLLDIVQHPIMPITILQRLRSAMSVNKTSLHGPKLTVALWTCTMALVGNEFEVERNWALQFIIRVLADRYGPSWPQDWIFELRQDLQQVLWHHRIEVAFKTICTRVCHLRNHVVDHMTQ